LVGRYLANGFMSLFFPADCLLCESPLEPLNRSFICFKCWQKVKLLPEVHCVKCGKPLPSLFKEVNPLLICFECKQHPPYFSRLFSPTIYQGVMAEAIKFFKYKGKRGIVRGFARIIKYAIERFNLSSLRLEAIVPVPLHPRRLRERGFNQAEDIAKIIGNILNLPVWNNYLVRLRYTEPQTGLHKEKRQNNLKGAFSIKKKAKKKGKGRKILLVDDVYTTGATLNEAARVIKKDGVEVFSFALARSVDVGL